MATVAATATGKPRRLPRERLAGFGWSTLAWFAAIVFFFPVFWMVLTSFKQESAAYSNPPKFIFTPTLDEYRQVFSAGLGPYLANSAIATVFSVALVLLLATPAAYALSMRPVRRWRDGLFFFISTKMLPVVAAIVPIYLAVRDIGMLDSIPTLIVLYTAMNMPIAVWMMRSFFLEVPGEILEAARIDGADVRRELMEVVLPVVAPGLAATALICAIFSWNEFFFALNLTSIRAATMPVFLVGFITGEGLFWAKLAAAATLASVPVLIAGWVAQRQLVRGLSMGAIK
ncbi:MAG: carbohydrate ABC transporter permease [Solirubrobacterales bacterium]|nr:carbohydrate ABC transporter permease [Solirubrobacterales bacterium]